MTDRHMADTRPTSIVAFLLERLAEDEAAATAALRAGADGEESGGDRADPAAVRQSPARVLRDVAAKRAIVQMWLTGLRTRLVEHRTDGLELVDAAIVELAAVYADHPDFHSSWLPDHHGGADARGADARGAARRAGPGDDDLAGNVVDLRSGRPGLRPR